VAGSVTGLLSGGMLLGNRGSVVGAPLVLAFATINYFGYHSLVGSKMAWSDPGSLLGKARHQWDALSEEVAELLSRAGLVHRLSEEERRMYEEIRLTKRAHATESTDDMMRRWERERKREMDQQAKRAAESGSASSGGQQAAS
jgi:hypothetical protein